MTIIFGDADRWIDSIFLPRQSVSSNTNVDIAISVIRPGRITGISAVIDGVQTATLVSCWVQKRDGTEIFYGDIITNAGAGASLQVRVRNEDGATRTLGVRVLVFMRK